MYLFLPMAFLWIRMIVASREIDDYRWPDATMHENGYNHVTTDNRTREFLTDMSKMWKAELLKSERRKQKSEPGVYVSEDSRKTRIEGKRKETVDSWVDFAREEKMGSQGRKNRWLYWWADKRLSFHEPSFSNIRRPIRVPFNSWGGKRAGRTGRNDRQTKRSKLSYDRSDQDIFVAGLNGVKRMAEIEKVDWKIPFNSWGGKRADRSTDREHFLSLSENPRDIDLPDIIKDDRDHDHDHDHDHDDDDYVSLVGKGRNAGGDKYTIQTKYKILSVMYGWNWNGKHDDTFPYPIPFYHSALYNETDKDDYRTGDEITDVNDWWSII